MIQNATARSQAAAGSACCQFACIAPATNQVDTGHKNDETSRESGKPAGWIELKSILPGGNLMIFNGLHSCQHVQKAPSMDWLITVTRRRKRMEIMMICPQPAMISKDPGCSKRRCRCCAPPWPSIGGSKNGRIMEDMLKTRVTWFIMFNMNVSSTMVYHHSIMFFMFPHWLSNLRSINYCIFYQMYGRKYVVFFYNSWTKKAKYGIWLDLTGFTGSGVLWRLLQHVWLLTCWSENELRMLVRTQAQNYLDLISMMGGLQWKYVKIIAFTLEYMGCPWLPGRCSPPIP